MNLPILSRSQILLLRATGLFALISVQASLCAKAQVFNSGSNGSYGPMNIVGDITLQVPPDGIFHCTTVSFASGSRLTFLRNPLNTPVYILATGDVQTTLGATVDVSGQAPLSNGLAGGLPGPGGFAGGAGTSDGSTAPGSGNGPGGGPRGATNSLGANGGNGSFKTAARLASDGLTYGNSLLIPIVGGSGGGGTGGFTGSNGAFPGVGGGGGGGAILIASSTRISGGSNNSTLQIRASGGGTGSDAVSRISGGGSGGAIRLVSPRITGNFNLAVDGRSNQTAGGRGRTRIDTLDSTGTIIFGDGIDALGSVMMVFPNPLPKLNVTNVAGTAIVDDANAPVIISLPTGTPANQTVQVKARDFGTVVPIRVLLVPENGDAVTADATIDNSTTNPAIISVPVTVPINTAVNVQVFAR